MRTKGNMQKLKEPESSMKNCFEKKQLDKRTIFEQHRNKNFKLLKKLRKSNF